MLSDTFAEDGGQPDRDGPYLTVSASKLQIACSLFTGKVARYESSADGSLKDSAGNSTPPAGALNKGRR